MVATRAAQALAGLASFRGGDRDLDLVGVVGLCGCGLGSMLLDVGLAPLKRHVAN